MEETVVKGGEVWFQMTIARRRGQIEMWVKVHPEVEGFMASLDEFGPPAPLGGYGKTWFSLGTPLKVYAIGDLAAPEKWKLGSVCGPMKLKCGEVNLSFLQFVGASSPEGVRFGIKHPISRDSLKDLSPSILSGVRSFIYEHISPLQINLRVSSQEL